MGLIPDEIISQIVDRCDIVSTISSYVPLKRAGRNFKANCPFHQEKTPSFIVNPDKQIFHCFGCGAGGNVIAFLMKQERLEFPETVRMLAEKLNIPIPRTDLSAEKSNLRQLILKVNELAAGYFHQQLLIGKDKAVLHAREYLKKRDVSLQMAKNFQLGFAADEWDGLLKFLKEKDIALSLMEKAGLIIAREDGQGFYDRFRNRIIFPIFDSQGHCRAFGARILEGEDGEKAGAKYINSPETPYYTKGQHLYGFHLAKPSILEKDFVVVVEGYMDCLMPQQAGITNVAASLGTALTVDQIRLLRRFTKNVVILFDMDKAGQSAALRSLDTLIEEGVQVKVASLKEGYDPDSFLRAFGAQAFQEQIEKAQTLFDYKLNYLFGLYDSKTIEGKAKIAGEILPTIQRFNNAVLETGYTKQLSLALHIPQEALLVELRKIEQRDEKQTPESSPGKTAYSQEKNRIVEYHLLRLLLEEESFIPLTIKELTPLDFQDRRVRQVISRIFEFFEEGKKISIGSFIHSFEDESLQQMISKVMVEDHLLLGKKEKIHQDCLQRLKTDRSRLKRQELLEEIKKTEIAGDQLRLDELKEQFNQLVKKPQ